MTEFTRTAFLYTASITCWALAAFASPLGWARTVLPCALTHQLLCQSSTTLYSSNSIDHVCTHKILFHFLVSWGLNFSYLYYTNPYCEYHWDISGYKLILKGSIFPNASREGALKSRARLFHLCWSLWSK